jgi:hypothetical protein
MTMSRLIASRIVRGVSTVTNEPIAFKLEVFENQEHRTVDHYEIRVDGVAASWAAWKGKALHNLKHATIQDGQVSFYTSQIW